MDVRDRVGPRAGARERGRSFEDGRAVYERERVRRSRARGRLTCTGTANAHAYATFTPSHAAPRSNARPFWTCCACSAPSQQTPWRRAKRCGPASSRCRPRCVAEASKLPPQALKWRTREHARSRSRSRPRVRDRLTRSCSYTARPCSNERPRSRAPARGPTRSLTSTTGLSEPHCL